MTSDVWLAWNQLVKTPSKEWFVLCISQIYSDLQNHDVDEVEWKLEYILQNPILTDVKPSVTTNNQRSSVGYCSCCGQEDIIDNEIVLCKECAERIQVEPKGEDKHEHKWLKLDTMFKCKCGATESLKEEASK